MPSTQDASSAPSAQMSVAHCVWKRWRQNKRKWFTIRINQGWHKHEKRQAYVSHRFDSKQFFRRLKPRVCERSCWRLGGANVEPTKQNLGTKPCRNDVCQPDQSIISLVQQFSIQSNANLSTLMNEHLTRRKRGIRLAKVRVTQVQHAKCAIGNAKGLRLDMCAGRTNSTTGGVSRGLGGWQRGSGGGRQLG